MLLYYICNIDICDIIIYVIYFFDLRKCLYYLRNFWEMIWESQTLQIAPLLASQPNQSIPKGDLMSLVLPGCLVWQCNTVLTRPAVLMSRWKCRLNKAGANLSSRLKKYILMLHTWLLSCLLTLSIVVLRGRPYITFYNSQKNCKIVINFEDPPWTPYHFSVLLLSTFFYYELKIFCFSNLHCVIIGWDLHKSFARLGIL